LLEEVGMKAKRWLYLAGTLLGIAFLGAYVVVSATPASSAMQALAAPVTQTALAHETGTMASLAPDGSTQVCLSCTDNPDNCNQLCESGVGNCVHATHCCRCMVP